MIEPKNTETDLLNIKSSSDLDFFDPLDDESPALDDQGFSFDDPTKNGFSDLDDMSESDPIAFESDANDQDFRMLD